ncbi:protein SCO1, mitochondrial [Artemisia annua]|uniref:Protein SCO1, mitochondrial n=1 Tax=Artemisia annua TaxID=35608 RepID=A0A2U1P9U4_ARTAN|nr:protein SCO1, mitochondrial [Artemisia annua]
MSPPPRSVATNETPPPNIEAKPSVEFNTTEANSILTLELIDSNGKLATEKDLKGNWILLYFGYTSSPDVGPTELLKLTKAIKTLASSDLKRNIKVQPVFVTLDLQRDTPSPLRAYLKVFFKKDEEDGDDYLVESSHNMWIKNLESQGFIALLLLDDESGRCDVAKDMEFV